MKNNLKTIAYIVGIVLILSATLILIFVLDFDLSFKAIVTGILGILLLMLVDSFTSHYKEINKPF